MFFVARDQDDPESEKSPQIENGYVKIANELLEAKMKIRFSPYDNQIWECIIRQTYGWNRKLAPLTTRQISFMTEIGITHISRSIKRLKERNMIVTQIGKNGTISYGIQKNYKKWKELPIQVITQTGKKVTRTGNEITHTGKKVTRTGKLESKELITNNGFRPPKDNKDIFKDNKDIKNKVVEATAINQIHLTYNYQKYKDRFGIYNWAQLNKHGYVILAKNNIPSKGETITEHKWIFENIRKIPIVPGFVVYDKDNNKANNNIDNLIITSLSEQILARRQNREPEEVLPFSEDSVEFQLSKLLFDLIKKRKPDFKKPNIQKRKK